MKRYMQWLLCGAAALGAQAQTAERVMTATISGSGGTSGKCTLEVRVDVAAEVDVYGDSGRLRTSTGQPATWTRFVCSDPLPYSMSDFRFKGIDGRGSVRLLQDPRRNNGMAVVRIDDPRQGWESYTFDIEWSGASGGYPTGGFYPAAVNPPPAVTSGSAAGASGRGREWSANSTAERAMDLCRAEVHARGERDYGLRDIDVTAIAVDINQGRNDVLTGTFSDRSGGFRRSGGYRFNCSVDFGSGQVRTIDILRADGSAMPPTGALGAAGAYGQDQAFRACQDAVVARTNRDGYQNVNFNAMAVDPNRSGWLTGSITASRGPVTDTFDFGCSMDFASARVRNVEMNRR